MVRRLYQQRFWKSGDICWFGENDISTNDEFLNEDVGHSEIKEAPFKLKVEGIKCIKYVQVQHNQAYICLIHLYKRSSWLYLFDKWNWS